MGLKNMRSKLLCELMGSILLMQLSSMVYTIPEYESLPYLANGLAVMIIIHCFGVNSGGHANPTVTLCCCFRGFMSFKEATYYILTQFLGFFIGYSMLATLLPEKYVYASDPPLGILKNNDDLNVWQKFGIEFLLALAFLLSWHAAWDPKALQFTGGVPLRIGYIFILCGLAGSIFVGGVNLNIAKTLAPAVFHRKFDNLHTYAAAQITAAIVSTMFWNSVSSCEK